MQVRFLILILALMPALLLANICTRKEYDKKRNRLIPVKGCCKGFRLDDNSNQISCKPICDDDCGKNGTCISPNSCSCSPGYENLEHNLSRICVPVCIGCTNGECIAPDTCHCDAGYQWNESTNHCVPVCATGCPNGLCVSPGNCSCHSGYTQSEADQSCTPICTDECAQDRFCSAPNTCSCQQGYTDLDNLCIEETTETTQLSLTPNCKDHNIMAVECLIAIVKRWIIEILVGILFLLTLITVVCLVMCRMHKRK